VKDFKSTAFGIKLYKLAQEMQIENLKDELVEFFKQTKSSEIFDLFDLYQMTGNKVGLDHCKLVNKYSFLLEYILKHVFTLNQVLETETKEAVESPAWLNVSSNSMLEFLNMDCMNINEADVVRALTKWGNFQMYQNGDDPEANLRSKVLPGLGKIRFGSLTQQELVQLCQEELGKVLSGDEKSAIFMSIISGNWELMPSDVISPTKLAPRHEPYAFCSLPYGADPKNQEIYRCNKYKNMLISFKVGQKAEIVGVKLNLSAQVHDRMTFSLRNDDDDREAVIATGSVKVTALHRGEVFCPFNTSHTLHPCKFYSVHFTCNGYCVEHRPYNLPKDYVPSISDGLLLRILTPSTYVHVQGLVFKKVDTPTVFISLT
jgi:hypothetical protein